jgi:hypothetical protein
MSEPEATCAICLRTPVPPEAWPKAIKIERFWKRQHKENKGPVCNSCMGRFKGHGKLDVLESHQNIAWAKKQASDAVRSGNYEAYSQAQDHINKALNTVELGISTRIEAIRELNDKRESIQAIMDELMECLANSPSASYFERRKAASYHTSKPEVRVRILMRDGYACKACGDSQDLTLDHILPVIEGGSDEDDNLQCLCRRCNSSKGPRLMPYLTSMTKGEMSRSSK